MRFVESGRFFQRVVIEGRDRARPGAVVNARTATTAQRPGAQGQAQPAQGQAAQGQAAPAQTEAPQG